MNEGLKETISLMDILNDKFGLSNVVLKEYADQLGSTLSRGATDFKSYAKMAKEAIRDTIGALIAQGVATAVTNALSNPLLKINPFLIPVIAGLASGLAKTAFNSLIPAFAEGGLVTGPTLSLIGEGSGTSMANPEVVAPLDKLKSYMNTGASQTVEVFGRISGNDIFLSNSKSTNSRLRSV